jgi:hypothetical protein
LEAMTFDMNAFYHIMIIVQPNNLDYYGKNLYYSLRLFMMLLKLFFSFD